MISLPSCVLAHSSFPDPKSPNPLFPSLLSPRQILPSPNSHLLPIYMLWFHRSETLPIVPPPSKLPPTEEHLASGADGGELILWKLHSTDAGEVWKVLKSLAFHHKDVLDLQWSNDGAHLISGSVDNTCIIWVAKKGSVHQILDGHFHYVQGVAWDPLTKYAASLSSDRTCRIYINKPSKSKAVEKTNYVCQHVIAKAEPQMAEESEVLK